MHWCIEKSRNHNQYITWKPVASYQNNWQYYDFKIIKNDWQKLKDSSKKDTNEDKGTKLNQ